MDIINPFDTIIFLGPKVLFWSVCIFVVVGVYSLIKDIFSYDGQYKLSCAFVLSLFTAIYFGFFEKFLMYKSGAIDCLVYIEKRARGGINPCSSVEWYGSNYFIYGLFVFILIIALLIMIFSYKKNRFYY